MPNNSQEPFLRVIQVAGLHLLLHSRRSSASAGRVCMVMVMVVADVNIDDHGDRTADSPSSGAASNGEEDDGD